MDNEKIEVRVSWSVVDEFWTYTNIGENKKEFDFPKSFECSKCQKDFIVNGSDY